MVEIARLDRLARHVQFAVEIEPEPAHAVARESDVHPRLRHDRFRGDDYVVDRSAHPGATAVLRSAASSKGHASSNAGTAASDLAAASAPTASRLRASLPEIANWRKTSTRVEPASRNARSAASFCSAPAPVWVAAAINSFSSPPRRNPVASFTSRSRFI